MFALQNMPAGRLELGGLELENVEFAREQALFDVSLTVLEDDGALLLRLEYASDLFRAESAHGWANAFENLLREGIASPQEPLARLDVMDAETRHELLVVRNPAPRQPHPAPSVPAAVLAWAARQPNAVAVADGERQLTYGELAAASARMAARLADAGVGPEDAVAIVAERSLEAVVAQLAVLRAGGYYVPLLPDLPDVRLRFILADRGCRVVLSAVPPSFESDAKWVDLSLTAEGASAFRRVDDRRIRRLGRAWTRTAEVRGSGPRAARLRDLHLGLDR